MNYSNMNIIDDRDFMQGFKTCAFSPAKASTSSIEEIEDMLAFETGGSSSATSSPMYSSPIASALERRQQRLFTIAPRKNDPRKPGYNARLLPDLTFGEGTRPLPRPISSIAEREYVSFFTEQVSEARRNSGNFSTTLF